MAIVYLGIGSNIGNRKKNCELAVERISSVSGISMLKRSSFYETEPVGGPPQRKYLNGVVKIRTELSPVRCLEIFKDIEKEMGRKSSGRNYPRIIDIDILLYGARKIRAKNITVPHPRMHERYFVLKGLKEIAPGVRHPGLKRTVRSLYYSLVK